MQIICAVMSAEVEKKKGKKRKKGKKKKKEKIIAITIGNGGGGWRRIRKRLSQTPLISGRTKKEKRSYPTSPIPGFRKRMREQKAAFCGTADYKDLRFC